MSFEEKYQKAIQELQATRIWKSNHTPPIHKLARAFGMEARPPHYSKPLNIFVLNGVYFALVWGVLMWFLFWSHDQMSAAVAIITSIVAGALFGGFMNLYYRISARKHNLTPWDEL